MILQGTVLISVPPEVAAEGFQRAETLIIFLTSKSELTQTGPGSFDFIIIKELGPVTLRLPGKLTVSPEPGGLRFTAAARHILGGSATLSLHLGFAEAKTGCTLSYDGTLESTGLAGRLLRDQADQAQIAIDTRFSSVKFMLENRRYTGAV